MKKIWKNPFIYALCAAIPLSAAMSFTMPDEKEPLFDTKDLNQEEVVALTPKTRVLKHIAEVRSEIGALSEQNGDVMLVFEQFISELHKHNLPEGDLHMIIEGTVFAAEFQKDQDLLKALQTAHELVKTGKVTDKDILIAALIQHTGAHHKDIKDSFGIITLSLVEELENAKPEYLTKDAATIKMAEETFSETQA